MAPFFPHFCRRTSVALPSSYLIWRECCTSKRMAKSRGNSGSSSSELQEFIMFPKGRPRSDRGEKWVSNDWKQLNTNLMLSFRFSQKDESPAGLQIVFKCQMKPYWDMQTFSVFLLIWQSFIYLFNLCWLYFWSLKTFYSVGNPCSELNSLHFVIKSSFMSFQSSRDLVCFVQFDNVNVYFGKDVKNRYKAPTDFCFVLKVSPLIRHSPLKSAQRFCLDLINKSSQKYQKRRSLLDNNLCLEVKYRTGPWKLVSGRVLSGAAACFTDRLRCNT